MQVGVFVSQVRSPYVRSISGVPRVAISPGRRSTIWYEIGRPQACWKVVRIAAAAQAVAAVAPVADHLAGLEADQLELTPIPFGRRFLTGA
jgi:hypothetical protein